MSQTKPNRPFSLISRAVVYLAGIVLAGVMMIPLLYSSGVESADSSPIASDLELMDLYDRYTAEISDNAREAALSVRKLFWVQDGQKAPTPCQTCYGHADSPQELKELLEKASELLDGQETVFRTDLVLAPNSGITYYFDETILAITWRQVFQNAVYTMSEIKISHPSQFGRYLAGGEYHSDYLYQTWDLGNKVNAVVASSADHYRGRQWGTIVYNKEVRRTQNSFFTDVCYVDENGDLILQYHGKAFSKEEAQKFVNDHEISFSLAFGPILVDNGVRCEPAGYALGEVNDGYPRAALCQKDKLHYLLVNANGDMAYWKCPSIHVFADVISQFGCQKAYALDGGKTASISMNGKQMNPLTTYRPRPTSDIIYFTSSLPNP